MANKLTSITTQYRTFKVDQVLTHTQLNESIAFFEDQDRLTRVFLNGVGLVCGFEVESSGSPLKISISQGVGVTTDGDILKLMDDIENKTTKSVDIPVQEFTHFRNFEDDKGRYNSHFKKANDQPIELRELVPTSKIQETDQPVDQIPALNEKVVLLYLENYANEADLCAGIDCDNQGVQQVSRIRVLLTNKAGAAHLISKDAVYRETHTHQVLEKLPKIDLKRVLLQTDKANAFAVLESSFTSVMFQKDIKEKLYQGFATLFDFLQVKKFESELKPYLDNFFNQKRYTGFFQYDYGWLKDVIATYHEIRDLFLQLDTVCLPDIKAFPKHLMLGLVNDDSRFPAFRHGFYASPATGNKQLKENLFHLIERLLSMVKLYGDFSQEIKITPSHFKGNLGSKAIPFYYKPSPHLIGHWSYEAWRLGQQAEIYRYHGAATPNSESSINPLDYDLGDVDFFRVEGHQGHHYERALVELKEKIYKHRLDFEVKAIGVDEVEMEIDPDDYSCHFEDLMVLLEAWNDEMTCATGKIAAFFSEIDVRKILGTQPEEEKPSEKPDQPSKDTIFTKYRDYREVDFDQLALMIKRGEITLEEAKKIYPHLFESTKTYITKNRERIQKSVSDNISVDEGKLGMVFNTTLASDTSVPLLKYSEIKLEAEKQAAELIKKVEMDRDIEEAFVLQPIDIIATAYDISYHVPERLRELNEEYMRQYEASVENLCELLKVFSQRLEKVEISDRMKSFYQTQALSFTTICCAANKLKILQAEIDNRKAHILKSLKFPKFLEAHPGLEHHAGVTRGGTFVLVYINKARAHKKSKLKWADKTVVADFMLPYRCCSDCTPINFVVPRPVVFLSLQRDIYCLGLEDAPIPFEVFPIGGKVSPTKEIDGLIIGNGSIQIDPERFSEAMLGETISFTVDGEPTTATLTVLQAPRFELVLPEMPVQTKEVQLKAEPIYEDADYLWNFGDGSISDEKSPRHTYEWPVNDEQKVTVTLTITPSNGACPSTVSGEVVYEPPVEEVSLHLEPKEICRDNHPDPIAFEVSPEDGKVQGDGVSQVDGKYYFDPKKVSEIKLGKPLNFTVNGKETDLEVRVYKKPSLDFSYEITQKESGRLLLHLQVASPFPENTQFVWTIDGQERDDTFGNEFTAEFVTDQLETKVSVMASLHNVCEFTRSETKTIPLNVTQPEPTACIDEGVKFIQTANHKYTELISSREFEKLSEWEKDIIKAAEVDLGRIAKSAQDYLSGVHNQELPDIFNKHISAFMEYILEMNSEEDTFALGIIKGLYALYVQLFYTLIKCQDKRLIDEYQELIDFILRQITQSMAQLREHKVSWDPNQEVLEFLSAISKTFEGVEFIVKHINDQIKIISR